MSDKILQQIKIGEKMVWYLGSCDFVKNGVRFKVVGSESTGPGIYEVTHTIKNMQTGTYASIKMPKLIELLQSDD